jgi:hypothetical protein
VILLRRLPNSTSFSFMNGLVEGDAGTDSPVGSICKADEICYKNTEQERISKMDHDCRSGSKRDKTSIPWSTKSTMATMATLNNVDFGP